MYALLICKYAKNINELNLLLCRFNAIDYFCQERIGKLLYCYMEKFSSIIRKARENKGWLLRQAAAKIDIDQSLLSKFETGDRRPTREQVEKFSTVYEIELNSLLISWLSDKIVYEISSEENAIQILKVAEEKIIFINSVVGI